MVVGSRSRCSGGSVFVALSQFNLARTSADRQDRAYVLVSEAHLEKIGDQTIKFVAKFENFGKTPAKDTKGWMVAEVASYPLTETLFQKTNQQLSAFPVAPTGSFDLTTGLTLSLDQIAVLKNGTKAIYVHGEITYTDAFGQTRYTRYRMIKGGNLGMDYNNLGVAVDGNKSN